MFTLDNYIVEDYTSKKLLTSDEQENHKKKLVETVVKKFKGNLQYIPQEQIDILIMKSFNTKNIPPEQVQDIVNKVKSELDIYNPEVIQLPPSDEPMIADDDVADESDMFGEEFDNAYNEIFLIRQTRQQKKLRRKRAKINHKGTNWNVVKPKKGFKRVKIGNVYIRMRETANERTMHSRVGRAMGQRKDLRK